MLHLQLGRKFQLITKHHNNSKFIYKYTNVHDVLLQLGK